MSPEARLRDEAVEWVVRLSAEDADETRYDAFRAWLDTSPEARRAYDVALEAWLEPRSAGAERATDRPPVRRRVQGAKRHAGVAAVVTGVVVLAAAVMWLWSGGSSSQVLRTTAGERREFALADGTHVTLSADSLVTVRLGLQQRQAIMGRGDAVFRVAPSVVRPFEVVAGDDALHVVGTEFGVHRRDGRLRIIVRKGLVAIGPARGDVGPRVRLPAGSELNHKEGTQVFQVATVDPSTAFAW